MKRCPTCGAMWTRPDDHNCGYVVITRDRLRTLEEAERAAKTTTGGRADG